MPESGIERADELRDIRLAWKLTSISRGFVDFVREKKRERGGEGERKEGAR